LVIDAVREFLRLEAAGGVLLLLATIAAMIAENTGLNLFYNALLSTPLAIQIGEFVIAKPLLLWINEGLMAMFFFLVGLEIKREILQGELSEPARVALPVIGAVGGMAVPALIYVAINWGDPIALQGWAIPSATDIAFALGVLSLLGSRVPNALKLFLLTLAIVDDLGAVVIIALFYSADLSVVSLWVAAGAIGLLFLMNRKGVLTLAPYLLVGLILWASLLKSGVHATLAGVVLALFIPLRVPGREGPAPLEEIEKDLHPAVTFGILPLFAFANAGIPLDGLSFSSVLQPVPLGIALGLFLGNQIGIFGFCWVAVKLGAARLPNGVAWGDLYGVAVLCGIGFTMSLFISSLAFEQRGIGMVVDDRLGILAGSILSTVVGLLILRWRLATRYA
jgi:NhaA family Na+:H+ antiporter